MSERPILFSGPMVNAIIAGRKTVTRRVVKPQPDEEREGHAWWRDGWFRTARYEHSGEDHPASKLLTCPYVKPGTRLWVRETWRPILSGRLAGGYDYRADDPSASGEGFMPWKLSIFMPRAASRLTLEVVSVRVERLQDVTEADAVLEGLERREHFIRLWNELNGKKYPWESNPFVWRVEFRKLEAAQ